MAPIFTKPAKPALARRDELLDTAQRLFATQGYDTTSVNQIIAEVGVSKGAFYHHFSAKEDLIEALAARFAVQSVALADDILNDPTLDSFARLSGFLGVLRAHKMGSATEMRRTLAPLLRPENSHLFLRVHHATADVMRPLLVRIIAEGAKEQVFDTPDPAAAADIILHLMTAQREDAMGLMSARGRMEFEAAAERMMNKLVFLGSVVDRILGLPEGSIELADREALDTLTCAFADAAA